VAVDLKLRGVRFEPYDMPGEQREDGIVGGARAA